MLARPVRTLRSRQRQSRRRLRRRASRRGVAARPAPPRLERRELDAAIQAHVLRRVVRGGRLGLAEAARLEALRVDPLVDEELPHRRRAPLRELLVVGVAAARVGMPVDANAQIGVRLEDRHAQFPEQLLRIRVDLGAVRLEVHVPRSPAPAVVHPHELRGVRAPVLAVEHAVAIVVAVDRRDHRSRCEIDLALEALQRRGRAERARGSVRSAAGRLRELLQKRSARRIAADLHGMDAELALVALGGGLCGVERLLLGHLAAHDVGGQAIGDHRDRGVVALSFQIRPGFRERLVERRALAEVVDVAGVVAERSAIERPERMRVALRRRRTRSRPLRTCPPASPTPATEPAPSRAELLAARDRARAVDDQDRLVDDDALAAPGRHGLDVHGLHHRGLAGECEDSRNDR